MAKPTKEVEAGMKKVGLEIKNADGTMRPFSDVLVDMREGFSKLSETEKVQTATMMFGKQAMAGMLSIINASDEDFQKLTNSIDNSAGSTERMAAIMSDNLKGSFDNMKSALESAGIAIKETLTPTLRGLMDKVAELATSFKNLNPATQETIIKFAALAAAIGPVLLIAGKLFGVLGTVTGALAYVAGGAAAASPAIAGLGAIFGVLGKVMVALTSGPIGLVVAGLAGIGIAAVKVAKHLSKDAIPEVELFGEGVSEATEKAVGSFLELEESATKSLNQMLWSGSEVTQEYKTTIVDNFNQMKDQVVASLNEQKTEAGNVLIKMFEDMDDMSKEEKDRMLEITNQTFDERIQLITEGNERIKEIMELASAEKRELTTAEAEEIQRIQAELKDLGIQTLSETEQEYKVIRQRMADQGAEISARGAAEIVQSSLEQKNETIKNAEAEYDKRIKLAEQIRAKGGKEAEETADKIIEEAKRQKEDSVKEATQMHDDVVKEAKAQAKEHVHEVDWETGEVLSKWGVFKGKMSSLAGDISSNVSSEWTRIKENTSESWNNALEAISEAMTNAQEVAGRLSESIQKSVGDRWNNLKQTTKSGWDNMKSSIVKSMEDAKTGVSSALNKMKALFKFEWSLPKIKLPHFRKTGSKTIGPLTVPTFGVSWYKKGAIFNKPTLFNTPYGMKGVGEAGAEAVLPIEKLSGIMSRTLSDLGYNSNSFDEMKLAFNEMKNGGLNWAKDTSIYKEPNSIRAEQELKEIKDLLQNLDKPLNINIDGRTIARVLAPLLNEELSFDNKRRMGGLGLA